MNRICGYKGRMVVLEVTAFICDEDQPTIERRVRPVVGLRNNPHTDELEVVYWNEDEQEFVYGLQDDDSKAYFTSNCIVYCNWSPKEDDSRFEEDFDRLKMWALMKRNKAIKEQAKLVSK
jgi:hypothetical protein